MRAGTGAAAVLVMAAAALAGCSDDEVTSAATVPLPSTTVTTAVAPSVAPPDPYAVPAIIDVAYVNRVLAGLDAAVGDVVRLVVRTRSIPQEAIDRLHAIYADGDDVQLQLDTFRTDLDRGFAGYRPDPGNQVTTAAELIAASPNCIFARIERDFSAVGSEPSTRSEEWIGLRPRPLTSASTYNPTTWLIVIEGFQPGGTQPPNPCAD